MKRRIRGTPAAWRILKKGKQPKCTHDTGNSNSETAYLLYLSKRFNQSKHCANQHSCPVKIFVKAGMWNWASLPAAAMGQLGTAIPQIVDAQQKTKAALAEKNRLSSSKESNHSNFHQ